MYIAFHFGMASLSFWQGLKLMFIFNYIHIKHYDTDNYKNKNNYGTVFVIRIINNLK